ncbi:EipB family protein [Pelagibius sp. 7325]|uniref:EipB family protein n=1 Tax=Pelagibius sp. 7325 TaxID=3131994 RepID=UPI0030ED6BD1
MRRITAKLLLTLVCVSVGAPSATATPAAEPLLPHKAVYALSLGNLSASSSVVEAAGRFEFEWSDVCDGWAVNQRFRIALLYEEGLTVSFGWSLSSWESKDGGRYRFFIRRFDDAGESQDVRGDAELGPDGSGTAVFHDPERREVALPAGTLFPTRHTLYVLENAVSDATSTWALVFDGSGDEGLFGVSAALSRRLPPGAPPPLPNPLLRDVPSWRVNLAFYGAEAASVEPEQEQGLRLFANGVVDEMSLDYGDFVLTSELLELSPLPAPDCGGRF